MIGILYSLEFIKISQESYVMINGGVIIFFYIDNIIICYKKKDEGKAKLMICGLQSKYELSKLRDLK